MSHIHFSRKRNSLVFILDFNIMPQLIDLLSPQRETGGWATQTVNTGTVTQTVTDGWIWWFFNDHVVIGGGDVNGFTTGNYFFTATTDKVLQYYQLRCTYIQILLMEEFFIQWKKYLHMKLEKGDWLHLTV